jgi:hypothetical protein
MNIIGAGLTGCLAAYAFKEAVIHEFLPEPKTHRAVLRFRSECVSNLTGIPFKKVKVYKGVYQNGLFVTPDLRMMNRYSQKVTGGYYDRSIGDLSPSVRFVAPDNFHSQLLDHLANRIVCNSSIDLDSLGRPLISTLPLPVLLKKLGHNGWVETGATKAEPIFVTNIQIPNCDMYQTIYFPDTVVPYRASITGDILIVEATQPIYWRDLKYVLDAFGIKYFRDMYDDQEEKLANIKQEHGKFVPLEENERKNLMYELTRDHNIYSLGRHATWRKILLDDVVNDLNRIESMIKTSAYDRMLGKLK